MKKAYLKDIVREIKRTRKRFISIIAIVILGVAFYVGINTASPDMLNTYNEYMNKYNMFDLNLLSTVGFSKKDIEKMENIDYLESIEPSKTVNAVIEKEDQEEVLKVLSVPNEINDETINRVEIVDGKYPSKADEIVLDNKLSTEYKIGDSIEFVDSDIDLKDTFNITKYTIVGFANTPIYIELTRGNTNLANGTISGFALVLEDAFSMEEYTNIYARVSTENKDRTSEEYIEEIKDIQEKIEEKTDALAEDKYNELYKEAKEKIDDAKSEVQDAKDELTDAENELKDAREELENAQNELNSQKQTYNKQISEYENKIQEGQNKLESSKKELDNKQKELNTALEKVNTEEQKLLETEKNILKGTGIEDLDTYLKYLEQVSAPKEAIENVKKLIQGKAEIEKQKQNLKEYQNELNIGLNEYNQGVNTLNIQKQEFENNKKTGQTNIKTAENKINNGWKELNDNQKKFDEEKESALKEIEDAEKEIADSEEQLEDLSVKIYVLNLETNEGYVSYKSDCESVKTIGKVFPIIFFLVAALVSLTAMTRMVEENRGNIGTYKSLGYDKVKVATKYLTYSTSATLLGIILGILIGSYTLPWVIAKAYGILYNTMPTVVMSINMKHSLTAGVAAFASTTIATIFACYSILSQTPAKLMRPKSPKEGKKIFLEKMPFIWKHLSFTKKITARNVFRYKKRLFMTIIGIAGCTALIFTGFGLRSAISSIVNKQYNEIRKYDLEISLKDDLEDNQIKELNKYIEASRHTVKYVNLRQQSNDIEANGHKQNAYILGINNQEEIEDFVTIKNRQTKKEVNLTDNGVIITEKLSKLLDVGIGDEITIDIDDEKTKNVKIDGIAENYIYHYIYMSKNTYENVFNGELINNHIYLKFDENTNENLEENISKYLLENENVSQVFTTSSISQRFDDMLGSLNIVVFVLIICAALLALVVLYNLNSINIEERKRELATIKLLGFYNIELSNYVFRENIILTLIGAVLGLVLGVYLNFFVISTAEVDMVMFGRQTGILCYVFAFLMTIVFATIINLMMNKELRKIDMIESLKSVE